MESIPSLVICLGIITAFVVAAIKLVAHLTFRKLRRKSFRRTNWFVVTGLKAAIMFRRFIRKIRPLPNFEFEAGELVKVPGHAHR